MLRGLFLSLMSLTPFFILIFWPEVLKDKKFYGYEFKYGKLEKRKYPFTVSYITKDTMDKNAYPASLFLAGIEKSEKVI